MSHSNQLA